MNRSPAEEAQKPCYAVTIQPLKMILAELTAGRAEVVAIIPPGASPHTYEPRPSDLRTARDALFFFSVSDHLDAWAAKLPNENSARVIDLLPASAREFFPDGVEEDERAAAGGAVVDPHFWTDPLTVAALLPPLTAKLCEIDPQGAATYAANEIKFAATLRALDEETKSNLAPLRGRAVFLFHPSFLYLLNRYGISYAGSVEDIPGKEGSPSRLIAIIEAVKKQHIPAIFTEPQLPRAPAEVIAEGAKVKLAELDPNGGVPGRMTYAQWLRYNVGVLRGAYLQP
ncbi:MAG: metal ABC transporter substrate-binding protein [Candidatus Sumerlaeota bacterium]